MKVDHAPVTLHKTIYRYLDSRRKQGEISERSYANWSHTLTTFARLVGPDRPVSELRQRDIERWMERDVRDSTKRTDLSIVRTFVRWCVLHELMLKDVTIAVRGPRRPRRVPRGVPHGGIEAALDACIDERERAIVSLEAFLGLRACEVAGLQRGDVNLFNNTIHVTGKGSHERILPLVDDARRALLAYLAADPAPAGPLFRSRVRPDAGLSAAYVSQMVARIMRHAGLKKSRWDGYGGHSLRHQLAKDMLARGATWRDVQSALGHANGATVSIYAGESDAEEIRKYMQTPASKPASDEVA